MDETKNDLQGTQDLDDQCSGLSRRSFLTQVGIAGFAVATSPVLPIARHEPEHQSTPAVGTNDPEDSVSKNPEHKEKENHPMPLIKIDAIEGRSQSEVTALLDAVHRAVVKAFHVPVRDRYQVYQAHPKGFLVIQDTGLNISRTDKALIITVVSKMRDEILKRRFYKELTEQLASSASIAPSDVVVAIIENSAADWSFGNGEPQFLTGELG
jgi:phenylpyruvate tautomerase PptA (4-oxalocrotonate tautomerase family)